MIGAIIGDIAGSRFEFNNTKDYNFEIFHEDSLFTDDTIFTIAVAETLIDCTDPTEADFVDHYLKWGKKYLKTRHARFSFNTSLWIESEAQTETTPRSFGNGAIMRLSPIIKASRCKAEALRMTIEAVRSTHSHTEALIAAQAISSLGMSLRMRSVRDIAAMCDNLCKMYFGSFPDNMSFQIGRFDASCQYCAPLAIKIFRDSESFEDAIRKAVYFGGDSDTLAAIVGTLAEHHFGVPVDMQRRAMEYLPVEMRNVITNFNEIYR